MKTGTSITTRLALSAALVTALSTTSVASIAGNKHHNEHHNHRHHYEHNPHPRYARVVSAEPVYQFVTETIPKETCWTETVSRPRHSRDAAPLVAGVIGAAIGNHIGRDVGHNDHHTRVGTIAGAVIGATIGKDIARKSRHGTITEDIQRCETQYHEVRHKEIIAYDVHYKYRGHSYFTRTSHHPGKRIEVDCELTNRKHHKGKHHKTKHYHGKHYRSSTY
ncbi:glycine zipper 2TM domain-containing protein [Aurantivibrio plasticivorans]